MAMTPAKKRAPATKSRGRKPTGSPSGVISRLGIGNTSVAAAGRRPAAATRKAPRTAAKPTVRKPAVTAKKPTKQRKVWIPGPKALAAMRVVAGLMVVAGALIWMSLWINQPENLRINKVDWQGELRYQNKAELEALVAPYVATNLYLLDEVALEQMLEGLPWIREASLRKVWPQQLLINVEEQFPVAFWGDRHLMNQFGEVFPAELPEMADQFPKIYSPTSTGRVMAERYVGLMGQLRDLSLEVVELSESENGSWQMRLRDGQEVILGRKDQDKRIKRFKVGYVKALQANFENVRTIDLRYTNGFAIEWKRGSGGAAAVSSLGVNTQGSLGS